MFGEDAEAYNLVAEHERRSGHCSSNSCRNRMSTMGSDQICFKVVCGVAQVSNDHSKITEHVVNLLASLVESLPRLELYEKLQSNGILRAPLLNVFADVVDFSLRTYQFFHQRTFRMFPSIA